MMLAAPILIGTGLALAVAAGAGAAGLDRERAFYPTVLIVVASYYDLFAVLGGSPGALVVELAVTAVFVTAAVVGFRRNLWIVAAALALHGLFDLVHGGVVRNPGMPAWWPAFCSSYDLAAGAWLAWRMRSMVGVERSC
jgi:hypothetical protein